MQPTLRQRRPVAEPKSSPLHPVETRARARQCACLCTLPKPVQSLIIFLVFAAVVFSYSTIEALYHFGHFRPITPHHNDHCVKLGHSIFGAEDMTLYDGHLYVATDRRTLWSPRAWMQDSLSRKARMHLLGPSGNGNLYVFDHAGTFNDSTVHGNKARATPHFRALPILGLPPVHKDHFHPHGIYMLPLRRLELGGDKEPHFFVVCHTLHGDVVHVLQLRYHDTYDEPTSFRYVQTLSHPLFTDLNDIAALDLNNIYLTNTHHYEAGTWQHALEVVTRRAWGNLLHCTGDHARGYQDLECHVVLDHLAMPNGINLSPHHVDGAHTVYVAETAQHRILVFHRNENHHLTLKTSIHLDTHVDNIHVNARTGHLTAAAHPKLFELMRHRNDASYPSPSQVLHIHPADVDAHEGTHPAHDLGSEEWDVMEVFVDDGHVFSGSSAAVVTPPRPSGHYHLYVGGLYTKGLLMCHMNVHSDTVPALLETLNLKG